MAKLPRHQVMRRFPNRLWAKLGQPCCFQFGQANSVLRYCGWFHYDWPALHSSRMQRWHDLPAAKATITHLMASIYRTTFVAVSISVWLLFTGCQGLLFRRALPTANTLAPPTMIDGVSGEVEAKTTTPSPMTHEQSMAQVLDELEQVRAIDAQAQKRLLVDLKKTPLEEWPLVVDQFHSGLRYREQLKDRSPVEPLVKEKPLETTFSNEIGVQVQSGKSIDHQTPADVAPTASLHTKPGIHHGLPETTVKPTAVAAGNPPVSAPPSDVNKTRPAALASSTAILASHTTPVTAPNAKRLPEILPAPTSGTGENKVHKSVPPEHSPTTASESIARQDPRTTPDVAALTQLKPMQLTAGQPDPILQKKADLSSTGHDHWTQQLLTLATSTNSASATNLKHRASTASYELAKALVQLRKQAALSVRNLAFCTTVYDYGAYDEYTESQFQAGQQLSLYAEVENFQSCMTDQGYLTSLASSYELLDEKGIGIDRGEFPSVKDYCRNRRRDFHIEYGLSLPEQIAPGSYRLQLTIQDNLSHKTGTHEIAFEVAVQPAN